MAGGDMARQQRVRLFIIQRIVPESRGHESPCWIWQRYRNHGGYAKAEICGAKNVRVHRASYEAYVGPIPPGLEIDHLCSVSCCVNPAHLEPVTGEENRRRQFERQQGRNPLVKPKVQRTPRDMSRCKHGHEFTPENTRIMRNGRGQTIRGCRICLRESSKARKQRQRDRLKAAACEARAGAERQAAAFGRIGQRRNSTPVAVRVALHDEDSQ